MSRRRITPLNEATSFVKKGLDKEGFVKIFINKEIGKNFGSAGVGVCYRYDSLRFYPVASTNGGLGARSPTDLKIGG